MSVAVGFFTHIFDPEILSRYLKLKEDLLKHAQTMIVAEIGTPVPEALLKETYFFDFRKLKLNVPQVLGSKIVPGNCHLTMLAFFRRWPEFDYYWHVEYDVVFTGSWRTLLESWSDDNSDLVAPHLRTQNQEPNWHWWPSLQVPPAAVGKGLIRGFLPVYRISRRALECLDVAVRDGYSGHFEALVPTALHAASLRISDLGEGQFYTSSSSTDGSLDLGTMRYWPCHVGPLHAENFLYHPVKPPSMIEADLAALRTTKDALEAANEAIAAERAQNKVANEAIAAERAQNKVANEALAVERAKNKVANEALAVERAKNKAAEQAVFELLASTSWRVTAPARIVANYIRSLLPRRSS